MNSVLISVIIIFLNEENFLGEAIESVISQSYTNWEIILIDDGSTDGSQAVIKKYVENFSGKIFCFDHTGHQNRGMSASRNLGIQKSSGKFIAFLDADDVWMPEKLNEQIKILNDNPRAGMIYGRTMIWNSWDKNHNIKDEFYELGVEPDRIIDPPQMFFHLLKNKFQTPTTCNFMVRRELFHNIGIFEESFKGMYEDQVFFAKVFLNTAVYVSDQLWAKYRRHSESHSILSANSHSYYFSRIPFLKWLSEYIFSQGFDKSSRVYKAFQKEYWLCMHPWMHRFVSKSEKFLRIK